MTETDPFRPTRLMRKWINLGAIAFIGLVVLGLTIYFRPTSGLSSMVEPDIFEPEEPLSLQYARQVSGLPIPDSASDIRYAGYAEFVAFIAVLRFKAPEEDCRAFAQQVIDDHNGKAPDRSVSGLRAVKSANGALLGEMLQPLKVPWWDPQRLRSGLAGGDLGSHQPMVWIDLERGVCYYQYTD